jgi:type IV fimbrial biogenesis protein FimT
MYNKSTINLGLTLPELMITVCISGIIASVAIPSFMKVIMNNRATSIANDLVSALAYSRSEAIKRGLQVTIKHKGNAARVWDQGWDIFTDNNGDGILNMSDELLQAHEIFHEAYTLRTGATFAYWVAYLPTGYSDGARLGHDSFRLCDRSRDVSISHAIIINKTGRARVQMGTTICP